MTKKQADDYVNEDTWVIVTTDGSVRPCNPGPMSIGCFFRTQDGVPLGFVSKRLNRKGTSNQAEYVALIEGMQYAYERLGARRVQLWVDSQLVQNQLTGLYRVHAHALKKLRAVAVQMMKRFSMCEIHWSARNSHDQPIADALSKGNTTLAFKLIDDAYPYSDSGGLEDYWCSLEAQTPAGGPNPNCPVAEYGSREYIMEFQAANTAEEIEQQCDEDSNIDFALNPCALYNDKDRRGGL